jgi:hypothetical protein
MKTIKRLSTDWDIYADTVTIIGNLVVVGKSTTVESVETIIHDNFITLAANTTIETLSTLTAGIEVSRGPEEEKVGLRWHEEQAAWQYTNDGIIWKTFSRMIVEQDPAPRLGGNLIVQDSVGNSWAITSTVGNTVVIHANVEKLSSLTPIPIPDESVVISPTIRMPKLDADPTHVNGYSSVYAKSTSTGDTGLFVANENNIGQELITKRKAFIYSLIL